MIKEKEVEDEEKISKSFKCLYFKDLFKAFK